MICGSLKPLHKYPLREGASIFRKIDYEDKIFSASFLYASIT